MAELKVIWTNRALAVFQKTVYWYAANLGIQFAVTFAKNVDEAMCKILLMQCPLLASSKNVEKTRNIGLFYLILYVEFIIGTIIRKYILSGYVSIK